MTSKIVLDASALLALIQNEKGSKVIKPLLEYAVMSTVNIAETITALQRVSISSKESLTLITDIVPNIIPFDLNHARGTAELQPQVQHKGLSLGDRACITLGVSLKLPIYTADKIWSELDLPNAKIVIIR